MFQRDYILRMIEQLTQVMARYMRLKAQEKKQEVLLQLEEFYGKLMLPKAVLLLRMPDQELLSMLSVNGEPDLDKTVSLSLLFKEEGRVYEDLGDHKDSSERFNKAIFLMVTSARLGADIPGIDCHAAISELREMLRTYMIPAKTLQLLADYYTDQGQYGRAEDVWFELLESERRPSSFTEAASEFFERLRTHSDEELERGGLPRQEVEKGQSELVRRFGFLADVEPQKDGLL